MKIKKNTWGFSKSWVPNKSMESSSYLPCEQEMENQLHHISLTVHELYGRDFVGLFQIKRST